MAWPATIASISEWIATKANEVINAFPAWGGDVNAGSNSLSNLRNLTVHQNAAPAAPAAGDTTLYMDQADGKLKFKTSDGVVHFLSGPYQAQALTGALTGTNGTDGNPTFTYAANAAPLDHFLFNNGVKQNQGTAYTIAYAAGTVTLTFLSGYIPTTLDILELKIA